MKNKITIVNFSVLKLWSVYFNGQIKHSGKINPASLRYRAKCVENLKKIFPDQETEVVITNY